MKTIEDWQYQHIIKRELKNKDIIMDVSNNISHSFSGRLDILGLHTFFLESSIMLKNAIKLYEEGFFDSAFYSVRSALELARVITYFSDQEQPKDSEVYQKWIQGGRFPFDSIIKKLLAESGSIYSEVKDALIDFFDDQEKRLKRVNKYIHKQGYETFYQQSSFRSGRDSQSKIIDELFLDFITNSTVEISLLRLCIDPFPILLQDKSIMGRIHFQSMTEPYSQSTIELIGKEKVEKYQNTKFYKSHLEMYNENEELGEAAYNIVNYEFYDRSTYNEIVKQFKLLSPIDVLAIKIFNRVKSVVKIYFYKGFKMYFSDIESKREKTGFDSRDLDKVKESDRKLNFQYDGAFLSYFSCENTEFWVEHNEKLTESQITQITEYS